MHNNKCFNALPILPGALKRPHYQAGNFFTAQDLLTEQSYRQQRLRRHNRYLHSWGVVCGLQVVPASDPSRPWAVQVCPGYAIDCCGDEIEVRSPAVVDVRDYLWRQPLVDGQPVLTAYVGIRYAEQQVRPIPAAQLGCSCDDPVYQPSRIRDSFQVDILWTLPETPDHDAFELCEHPSAPCPECPDSPYVILACLTLPGSAVG